MTGTDLIDDYVMAVGRRLRGSRRMRTSMLTEIRDALVDSAEDAEHAGIPCREARRQAVDQFGSAAEIAAELQDVLAYTHARRTAWGLLAVLGTRHLLAALSGASGRWDQWWGGSHPMAGYTLLSRTVDVLALASLVLSAAAIVVFGRAVRRRPPRRGEARAMAVGTPIALVAIVGGGLLLVGLTPAGWTALAPVLLAMSWWLLPMGLVLGSAWRCWRAATA